MAQSHLTCVTFVMLLSLVSLSSVFADGCIMPPDYGLYDDILMPEQKAVLYWDGNQEQLIISTKVSMDQVMDFAWVVPIQSSSKPEVDEASEEIFFKIAELFNVGKSDGWNMAVPVLGGISSEAPKVEVIESKKLDIYDITILKATDGSALLNWLNQNEYSFPEGKQNVLDYYIELESNYNKPFYFIANKVNLQNKYPGIAITDYDRECTEAFYLDERLMFEPYIARELEEFVESEMPYYEECDAANLQAVTVLATLSLGISTPLKYSFTPLEPTYPMHMTSVNEGHIDAKLFLIGENCFDDKDGYFLFQSAVQNPSFAKSQGFEKGNCITSSTFSGNTSKLLTDSFFSEKPFNPEYSPNYVSSDDQLIELLGILFAIAIFCIIFALIILPLSIFFFGVGAAVFWAEEKFKNNIIFKAIAALPVFTMGFFLYVAFFRIYFWVPFLFTIFFAGFLAAGYICFKKKSLKLGAIYFISLFILLLIIFSILLSFLPISQIIY